MRLIKNCKLEIILILSGTAWVLISKTLPQMPICIVCYLTDDRIAGIVSLFAVLIGIYVTVWSILATSADRLNEELLKEKVEGQLFFVIVVDLLEAFITILYSVFFLNTLFADSNLLMVLIALSLVSFVKFVLMLIRITKLNVKFIIRGIDEKHQKETEIMTKIDEVYQRIIRLEESKTLNE